MKPDTYINPGYVCQLYGPRQTCGIADCHPPWANPGARPGPVTGALPRQVPTLGEAGTIGDLGDHGELGSKGARELASSRCSKLASHRPRIENYGLRPHNIPTCLGMYKAMVPILGLEALSINICLIPRYCNRYIASTLSIHDLGPTTYYLQVGIPRLPCSLYICT